VARAAFGPQIDDLFARTQQEARAGAKIVAWPEAAVLALKEDEAELIGRARTLAREEYTDFFLSLPGFPRLV
jgi:apolipoprotein N-acyltransferase